MTPQKKQPVLGATTRPHIHKQTKDYGVHRVRRRCTLAHQAGLQPLERKTPEMT